MEVVAKLKLGYHFYVDHSTVADHDRQMNVFQQHDIEL